MKMLLSRLPLLASIPLMVVGLRHALLLAPREKTLGDSQRIFYVHLPCAWLGFLAFLIVAIASALFLIRKRPVADRIAQACCEVGVLFTTLVLITGPIWAKNDWGIYWTWDARLTSTFVLWLLYIGYLMLRANATDPVRIRKTLAVYGIVAFLDVPLVYYSIQWFRTQHPAPVMGSKGGGMDGQMWMAVLWCTLAFLGIFIELVSRRVDLLSLEQDLEEIKAAREI